MPQKRHATSGTAAQTLGPCPLCGRPLIAGPSVNQHHWIPLREARRRDLATRADWIHVVCHRMIHRLFDERTLAREAADPETLRARPELASFLRWIQRQPPDYVDWPEQPGRHGRRRRR